MRFPIDSIILNIKVYLFMLLLFYQKIVYLVSKFINEPFNCKECISYLTIIS